VESSVYQLVRLLVWLAGVDTAGGPNRTVHGPVYSRTSIQFKRLSKLPLHHWLQDLLIQLLQFKLVLDPGVRPGVSFNG
jgi:hypothetical protein